MHQYDAPGGETHNYIGSSHEGLHGMSPRTVGALPLGEAVDPTINPQGDPMKVYELGYLVRSLADEDGHFSVSSLVDFLAGGEPVPDEDVVILEGQIQEVAEKASDIAYNGEGGFTVSFPPDDQEKPPRRYRPTPEAKRRLDRMIGQGLGTNASSNRKERQRERFERKKAIARGKSKYNN